MKTGSVSNYGKLRVNGSRLFDAGRKPVSLHGVSLFWSQWGNHFFSAEVIQWLAEEWKIDVLRVPLGVHEGGYKSDRFQEEHVRRAIEAAINQDVYVIADWHAHDPEPELAAEFFTRICKDYAHLPNLILELWNEPGPTYLWGRDIYPYHVELVERLRPHAPDTVMILGTERWSQRVDIAARQRVDGDQLCYSLHFYAETHGSWLRQCAADALRQGACVFISEWGGGGADGNGAIDHEELQAWLDFIDAHGLSDVNWSIMNKNETSSAFITSAAPDRPLHLDDLSSSGSLVYRRLQGIASKRAATA